MKTFLEFIAEAEGNNSQQIASLRARARMLRQKGDMAGAMEVEKQAGELQAGTQAKIAALTRDKPKTPTNPNSWVGGRPQSSRDSVSSVGTISNVSRERITNMRTGQDLGSASTPGVNVSGLHGDTRARSQKGGSVPTRNKGQGSVRPERGNP